MGAFMHKQALSQGQGEVQEGPVLFQVLPRSPGSRSSPRALFQGSLQEFSSHTAGTEVPPGQEGLGCFPSVTKESGTHLSQCQLFSLGHHSPTQHN